MINDAGKREVKNWCGIRSGPRRPARRRRGDRGGAQAGGAVSQGKGSGNQSWTRISTRCAKSLGWRGNRKLTLYRHTARWLGLVRPRGSGRVLFDAVPGPGLRGSTSMKSRETLIRLKKFQVEERRRRVAQIEGMISEFERISGDLEPDIKIEQDRSGIHDPGHFAYPTYAKAAMQRRDNLKRSADDLKIQLEDAKAALGEAFEEMKKVELLGERDQMREQAEDDVDEQAEVDVIGMMRNSASA